MQPTERSDIQNGDAAQLASLNVSGQTSLLGLTVQTETVTGDLTVLGLTTVQDIAVNGHIITGGSTPTATTLPAAGASGAAVQVSGNDSSGTITIRTGDATSGSVAGPAAGEVANLLFSKPYAASPRVVLSADNATSAALEAYPSNLTTTSFNLGITNKPAPDTTYQFTYFAVQ